MKYFFMKYKQRKSHAANLKIKTPNSNAQNGENVLQYIKEQYTEIYKAEEINLEAVDEIMENLPQVQKESNKNLVQRIS